MSSPPCGQSSSILTSTIYEPFQWLSYLDVHAIELEHGDRLSQLVEILSMSEYRAGLTHLHKHLSSNHNETRLRVRLQKRPTAQRSSSPRPMGSEPSTRRRTSLCAATSCHCVSRCACGIHRYHRILKNKDASESTHSAALVLEQG